MDTISHRVFCLRKRPLGRNDNEVDEWRDNKSKTHFSFCCKRISSFRRSGVSVSREIRKIKWNRQETVCWTLNCTLLYLLLSIDRLADVQHHLSINHRWSVSLSACLTHWVTDGWPFFLRFHSYTLWLWSSSSVPFSSLFTIADCFRWLLFN